MFLEAEAVAGCCLLRSWLPSDLDPLEALRTLYVYGDKWPDRATGWAYGQPPGAPWAPALAGLGPQLLAALERDTGYAFTAVAFQAYRNGTGCDWHHDRDWGAQAILSLGVTRTFGVRCGATQESLRLAHGDLVVMPPEFQQAWEHGVPVEDVRGERCSLVFRTALRE